MPVEVPVMTIAAAGLVPNEFGTHLNTVFGSWTAARHSDHINLSSGFTIAGG